MHKQEQNQQQLNDEAELWRLFHEQNNPEAREALIGLYYDLADILAKTLFADRVIREVEFHDYRQHALIGLMEAIDKYDPSKGAAFRTYATYRIRGAILNGVQKMTELHEQHEYRRRLHQERTQSIAQEEGKEDAFKQLLDVAIGLAIGFMLEDSQMYQDFSPTAAYRSQDLAELSMQLSEIVAMLPLREKLVIEYHYYEGLEFNLIAEIIGVGKARVSQIHFGALKQIREIYEQENIAMDL